MIDSMMPSAAGLAWKSLAVLAIAWGIVFALHGRSAALRHMVWTSAFCALLLLPVFSVALPALSVPREVPFGDLLATITATSPARQSVNAAAASAPVGPAAAGVRAAPDFRVLLLRIWAIGTALSLLRLLVACIAILRVRRSAHRLSGTGADTIAESLGMPGSIEVLAIPTGEIPSSFGRTIFLPVDVAEWDSQQRRAVLLHEVAHIQRGDTAVQILARIAWSAYWWNPLAWMAWRKLIDERERSVDDVVLQSGMGAADYASHLMELARSVRPAGLMSPVLVAMARQSKLEVRIMAILDSKRDHRVPSKFMALGVVAAALILFAPIAALRGQEPAGLPSTVFRSGSRLPAAFSAQEPVGLPADLDAMIQTAVSQRNAEALEDMALRAGGMGEYEIGKKLMKSALEVRALASGELSKEYGSSLLRLADLERRSGSQSARQSYVRALELLVNQPEAAQAIIALALIEIGGKNFDEAERMLGRASIADPKAEARGKMWLAVLREKQGRTEEADVLYRSALSLAEPQSEEAANILDLLARVLRTQNKWDEAGEFSTRAVAIRRVQGTAMASNRPASAGVYKIGNGVMAPSLLKKVEPQYSDDARVAHYEGTVVMAVEIGVDGTTQNVQVVRGIGLGLNEKAIEAVRNWKFRPGMKDGEAVPVMATIEVNFRLL